MNDIEAFVDMLSTLTGQPAWKLEAWLEIYWKLRVVGCLEEEEKSKAVQEAVVPEVRECGRMISAPTVETEDCGPSGRPVPTVEAEEEPATLGPNNGPEPPPAEEPEIAAPVVKLSGNGARRKREIQERLQLARAEKVKVIDIVRASGGNVGEIHIYDALNCRHLHTSKWEEISAALEKLGY